MPSQTDAVGWRERVEATRRGVPVAEVDRLVDEGKLSLAEIDRTILPRKTLAHRRILGCLTAEQSDRLARVEHVIREAERTFGSREKAAAWLRRPSAALGDETPLSLLDTSEGGRQVELLLGRVDHGIAA